MNHLTAVKLKRDEKSRPPFNSGVPIDVKLGMHPKLSIHSRDAPPPGTYNPFPIIGNRGRIIDWSREEASKEFSATMGGRFLTHHLVQRELMKSGRGPGTHEVPQWPESILESNCPSGAKDKGFGVAPRFRIPQTRSTPGPGYAHNYRERSKPCNSRLSSFEFDGIAPRFKRQACTWSIPCNRYDASHPESLDNILRKVTGNRGPYDLFTGPRDSTTLFGYLTRSKSVDAKNWPAKFHKTEFEKVFSGSNRYKGVWTDCPRFPKKPTVRNMLDDPSLCYKDPVSPGPGSYDPVNPRNPVSRSFHPFNDSVKTARPLRPFEISPGPGSYRATRERRITGNGWTSAFRSRTQRSLGRTTEQYGFF